jgi:NAD-dependent deacetylase
VSFSGAGLSAGSGIATFRDPVDGLWARYDPMKLASREGFSSDPDLVLAWYRERRRIASAARPNPAHLALAAWRNAGHITQNVDDLLERAGAIGVVHLHGRLAFDRCDRFCGFREPAGHEEPTGPRSCPRCGAPLRPDVVWFGEGLDPAEWTRAVEMCEASDVMLVVGTSGAVRPAVTLVYAARARGASIILVDRGGSEVSEIADLTLTGEATELVPLVLEPGP